MKVPRRLMKQTNVWIVLLLTALLCASGFTAPLIPIVTPLFHVGLTLHFWTFVLLDGCVVVDRPARMALGLLGCVVCSISLINAVFFLDDEQANTDFIRAGSLDLTLKDFWRVAFFNLFVFLAEAIFHDFRDRGLKRYLFVRKPKPRCDVLFSDVLTRSVRESRSQSQGHAEIVHRHDDIVIGRPIAPSIVQI
eukprot:c48615_g1_i1.p1 GENE.c48615_g1_i1~~c48615_g1_i1.p1  ORF type:complete len:217 (+),score=34.51 c48615_g1_i1:73-651(+)